MNTVMKIIKNESGMGILQISMVMSVLMMGGFYMNNKGNKASKQAAAMEFRLKMEQYRLQTLYQFMNNPHNCKCLLKDMEFAKASATMINQAGTSTHNQLGYFSTDCSTVTSPFINNIYGSRGERISSIRLAEVEYANFSYKGSLLVTIESNKSMAGSSELSFKIPIALKVKDATNPANVAVTTCSAISSDGGPIGSLIKTPYMDDPSENIISLASPSGTFSFNSVPPTASGVFIQYTIGSPANKRADRYCDIMGSNISIKLGQDSKGDGGQRFVAGTAYVPLDGCASDLRYYCNNNSNRGEFRVLAYVDDGQRPVCANSQFNCAAGTEPDGVGGCIATAPDVNVCQAGYIYDTTVDSCIPDPSPSCPAGQMAVQGVCNPITSLQTYITNYRNAYNAAIAAANLYANAINDQAAAEAAAASAQSAADADPTNTALASAAASANSAAAAASSATAAALANYRALATIANTFVSAVGPLPL